MIFCKHSQLNNNGFYNKSTPSVKFHIEYKTSLKITKFYLTSFGITHISGEQHKSQGKVEHRKNRMDFDDYEDSEG